MNPWVIIGFGYTGRHLASRLVGMGARVIAVRRGDSEAMAGVEARRADLAEPATLADLVPDGAIVVHAAPPDEARPGQGERNLVAAARGAARIVYVSSTGVYPPGDGGWVDEDSPVAEGGARLAAERALLEGAAAASIVAVALRASGIYGPGRGVVARMRAGTYRVVGGDTWVNRIHVHDLVSAIIAAGTVAALPRRIYTVADDLPVTGAAYAAEVAAALGLPPPPVVALDAVDARTAAMLGANRRISNRRLVRELGLVLRYPTFRESLAEELAAAG
ncbi:MAG TPA: NAD-dependent epimerase/dehydratase family protein [Kofleriaceae bacterium]|nr:NAD-dependent epimerase/dehydratase family protein [Kofleriaceae bacterium]